MKTNKILTFHKFRIIKEGNIEDNSHYCRIELKCIDYELAPEMVTDTKEQWEIAFDISDSYSASYRSEDGYPNADAYLYPGKNNLIQILDELDQNNIFYDNIDLPENVDKNISDTLLKRYRNDMNVSVNLNSFP